VKIEKDAGVKVVLNPAPARSLSDSLLSQVDVIVPNETEAHTLTGVPIDSTEGIRQAGRALLDRGAQAVITTLGADGSLLVEADRTTHVPAFPVKTVDTVGAGDAFVAGLAVALIEGRHLPEAALWGNAAGALATTRLGAQSSLPTRNEVEMLIARG
jgi:ribokinase